MNTIYNAKEFINQIDETSLELKNLIHNGEIQTEEEYKKKIEEVTKEIKAHLTMESCFDIMRVYDENQSLGDFLSKEQLEKKERLTIQDIAESFALFIVKDTLMKETLFLSNRTNIKAIS